VSLGDATRAHPTIKHNVASNLNLKYMVISRLVSIVELGIWTPFSKRGLRADQPNLSQEVGDIDAALAANSPLDWSNCRRFMDVFTWRPFSREDVLVGRTVGGFPRRGVGAGAVLMASGPPRTQRPWRQ
jgi:hypothetical protein